MIAQLFTIIAPIALCAAVGFTWRRFNMPYDGRIITRLVTMIGAPCLIFSTFMKFEVGQTIRLKIRRGDEILEIDATLGKWPPGGPR